MGEPGTATRPGLTATSPDLPSRVPHGHGTGIVAT